MSTIILYILPLLLFVACGTRSPETELNNINAIISGDSLRFNQKQQNLFPRAEVTAAYCKAIGEYLKAGSKNDKTTTDTLFIGKHIEFPDINLPSTINKTNIMLLTTEEAEKKLQTRKSLVYLNIIGWMQTNKAEFIIVTFFEGGKPQHNCHLYFTYRSERNEFDLDSLNFEYPYPKH